MGEKIEIRRRAFQKRLGVSVYPDGRIRVSSNKGLSQKEILKFLLSQKSWIEKSLIASEAHKKKYPPKFFKSGESYPYLGGDYDLSIVKGRKAALRFESGKIIFSSPLSEQEFSEEQREKYFLKFQKSYRQVAEKIMSQRIEFHSHRMKLYPKAVSFRGQKTIWGSCSAENKISLNYKLIVAPIQVVDYVLIHELAHIRHKNHSKAFWGVVEQFTDYRHFSRDWLKEHQFKADFLGKNVGLQHSL